MNTFNQERMDELSAKIESKTATAQEAQEFIALYKDLVQQLHDTLPMPVENLPE
jgi:hypothetical protein